MAGNARAAGNEEVVGPRWAPWEFSRESAESGVIFNIGSTAALEVVLWGADGTTVTEVEGSRSRVEPGGFLGLRFRVDDGKEPTFRVRWQWPNGSHYGDEGMQLVTEDPPPPAGS